MICFLLQLTIIVFKLDLESGDKIPKEDCYIVRENISFLY